MSQKLFRKKLIASSIAVVLGGGLITPLFAEEEVKADEVDEQAIVVTGIRGSLKEALNHKRFADAEVDSISAEDIGKFPDRNIAESLQRIPGVTIVRNFAGEGGNVSIRGTNPELTLVSLNGNYVASTGWFSQQPATRSFDMDLLPPELVAGVDVYKSPMAMLDEGGIGGTVAVRTRKPLDLDPGSLYLSAEMQNNSISEGSGQGITGMYSWNNGSNFGALVAFSKLETVGRAHKAENYMDDGWAGAGIAEFNQTRERDSFNLTLEYAPSDQLSMNLNYLKIDLDAANTNQNYLIIAGGAGLDANNDGIPDGVAAFNANVTGATAFSPANGFALNGTYAGSASDDTNSRNAKMDTTTLAYEVNYEGDDFTIDAKIGNTEANGGDGGNYNVGWISSNANQSIEFDMSGRNAMLLNPINADASNHSEYVMNNASVVAGFRNDEETFAQLDFKKDVDLGPISELKTGIKLRDHEFTSFSNTWTLQDGFNNGLTKDDFNDGYFGHSGVGLSGNTPTNIARVDGDRLRTFIDSVKAGEDLNDDSFGVIKEDIFAVYVQGDFSGDDYRGNIGLRYVKTDTSADYFIVENKGEANEIVTPAAEKSDYADWLPSFNLALNLQEDLILRVSAAKVISRPNYSFLNPAASVNDTTQTITRGTIKLDPFRATQSDIGLEWYFNDSSLLSATIFNKDIRSFIIAGANQSTTVVNGTTFIVNEPGQGLGGQLEGIELQYQQQVDDIGWSANITYTDGFGLQDRGENGGIVKVNLAGMSKISYNLSAFFENNMFSTRLAYTYRDEFIAQSTGIGGNTGWDSHGFLDANVTWHATQNIDASLEATNILEETTTQRLTTAFDAMRLAADNGRNVYLKVSYRL